MTAPAPRALLLDFYGTIAHGPGFSVRRGSDLICDSLRADGIAVDSAAFDAAYRKAVLPYLEVMRSGRETHNTAWVADALSALDLCLAASDARVVRAVRAYFEAYADLMEPLPGATETLAALAGRYPVVLVSNFTDALPVRASLDRFGWNRFFRASFVSAEIGIRKPHRDIFLRALSAVGCEPSGALFVGDDLEEDIAGAKAVGIPAVHVSRPRASALRAMSPPIAATVAPDHTIADITELPALLESAATAVDLARQDA
ncbi:MAG: HAD family hydrolase [Acidobacteriota bacterium]